MPGKQRSHTLTGGTRRIEAEWLQKRKGRRDLADCEPYVVRRGDTLYGIARKFKDRDTLACLVTRNSIRQPDKILVGQTLYIQMRKNDDKGAQPAHAGDGSTRTK